MRAGNAKGAKGAKNAEGKMQGAFESVFPRLSFALFAFSVSFAFPPQAMESASPVTRYCFAMPA